jgi:PAS domain S-box-containing protein
VRAEGVLHGMADAYVALDAAFRVTDVNPAMVRAVRLGRDAMLGRSFWELFPGTVGTAFEEHYRRVAGGGRDAHFTHDYSDGRLDLVSEVDVYPAPGGGIAVFWRDVTARVRAEAALRRREAKYRALFATMDQGFCIVQLVFDAAGRPVDYLFVEANPAFARQTGLADAVGRSARELVPGLEQHWVDLYARVARSGEPARFEQGSEAMGRWFDVHAFPVSDAADHRVAVLFTDVSGARQAARERERLLAESEAARRALEAARLRADRLQQLTEALAVPLTREQAVRAMIEQALSAVGAVAGGVLAVADDGRALELLDVVGYEEEVAERYQRLPPTPRCRCATWCGAGCRSSCRARRPSRRPGTCRSTRSPTAATARHGPRCRSWPTGASWGAHAHLRRAAGVPARGARVRRRVRAAVRAGAGARGAVRGRAGEPRGGRGGAARRPRRPTARRATSWP